MSQITFECELAEYRLPEGDLFRFIPRIGEKVECYSRNGYSSVEMTVVSVVYTFDGDVKIKLD